MTRRPSFRAESLKFSPTTSNPRHGNQRILARGGRDGPPARPTRSVRRLRRLTDLEVNEVVERYQSGDSIRSLAEEFGMHRTTISAQLKARGVLAPTRRVDEAQRSKLVSLYKQGFSLARVAEQVGVSSHTVHRVLLEAAVQTRPVGTNQWSARS